MKKITQEQYFALNNKILTRSKIMDYLKCPNYFYRKHITGEIAKKNNNPAFAIGGGVDDLLAQIETSRNIIVFEGDRRKPAINAEYRELIESGKNVVTSAQYDQIIGLASAVEETTAYKQIKNYKKQVLYKRREEFFKSFIENEIEVK